MPQDDIDKKIAEAFKRNAADTDIATTFRRVSQKSADPNILAAQAAKYPASPTGQTIEAKSPTAGDQIKTLLKTMLAPIAAMGPSAGNILGAQLSGGRVGSIATGGPDASLANIPGALLEGVTSGPSKLMGGIAESDPEQFAEGAGETITGTLPAIYGVKVGASAATRAGVNAVTSPERLMSRAAANRASSTLPITSDMSPTRMALRAGANAYRKAAAPMQERLAMWAAHGKGGPIQHLTMPDDFPDAPPPARTTTPVEMAKAAPDEGARIRSMPPPPRAPLTESPPLNIQRPGIPPDVEQWLSRMRGDLAPDPTDFRSRPTPTGPNEIVPPPGWSVPPATTTPVDPSTAALVNRWMNVSPKAVQRGANPAEQLIKEKLIAQTKAATKQNVEMALKDAGAQMDIALNDAGAAGIRFNLEEVVKEAIDSARKRIGAPKDVTFQNNLTGILDDIKQRYPNLTEMPPRDTHLLKVELGDSASWSGTAFDDPVNQVLVKMYRDINSQIKANVPGIAPLQDRWGNLYIGNKSLAESIAKDTVGRGTGATFSRPTKK